MGVRGAFRGVLMFSNNKVLELVGKISCWFRDCKDGFV